MRKKFVVLVLLFSSFVVFLPTHGNAAPLSSAVNKSQIRVQIGHVRHDRGLHRGWYKGRRLAWYPYNPGGGRWVRQAYWINGRQYVRWVRYNY